MRWSVDTDPLIAPTSICMTRQLSNNEEVIPKKEVPSLIQSLFLYVVMHGWRFRFVFCLLICKFYDCDSLALSV